MWSAHPIPYPLRSALEVLAAYRIMLRYHLLPQKCTTKLLNVTYRKRSVLNCNAPPFRYGTGASRAALPAAE